ncbi:MAG TPA: hypothetical protein EYQ21_07285 [Flavobacteriales bacterium]|nr:hypothetical protein [Flavobacteriales bacterium]
MSTTMMVKLAVSAVAAIGSTVMTMQAQKASGSAAKALGERNQQIRLQEKEAGKAYDAAQRKIDQRLFARDHSNLENDLYTGADGFDDILMDDIFSFEADQLSKTYQTKVFGVSKVNQGTSAKFQGDALKQQADLAVVGTAIGGIGKVTEVAITAQKIKES